jgi:iron complex outermembrane receptor protein
VNVFKSSALVIIGLLTSTYANSSSNRIEEVVVTARKVEESLQDVPIAVSTFQARDMMDLGISEPADIDNFAPGFIAFKQNGSQDNLSLSIRGVNSIEAATTADPAVGVYLDGVYLARTTGGVFDLIDIERVEVLRGPQGDLFGKNTIGGAISITSKKPTGVLAVQLGLTQGTMNNERRSASIDFPEVASLSVKASFIQTGSSRDYQSAYGGGDLGNASTENYRISGLWQPIDEFTALYAYGFNHRENNSNLHQLSLVKDIYTDPDSEFYGGDFYEQAGASASMKRTPILPLVDTSDDETTSETVGHLLSLTWDATESLTIKSISSSREWDSYAAGTDFGSFPVRNAGDVIDLRNGGVGFVPVGELISLFGATRDNYHKQVSQEFQFLGSFGEKLRYVAGIYYLRENGSEDNPQEFVIPTRVIPFLAGGPALPALPGLVNPGNAALLDAPFYYAYDNDSAALYAQLNYQVTEKLSLTLGARYSEDSKEVTLRNNLEAGSVATITESTSWSDFSPSATVEYVFNDEINAYAKLSEGYRSGGFSARAQTAEAFRTPYDQENLISAEIGLKVLALENTLQLNTAIFQNIYTDRQVSQFEAGSGGASSVIVNAGETRSYGFELEGVYHTPINGLQIFGSYAYLDVDYVEYISGPLDKETGFSTGPNRDISDEIAENASAPEHSGAFGTKYTYETNNLGDISVRLDVSYVDDVTFDPNLNLYAKADSYHLVNARATWSDIPLGEGVLDISLWVKNIENKEYREFSLDFGLLGTVYATYGPLRTAGLDLRYFWED